MRATAVFFLYLFCCLVLAALATYPLMASGWIALEPHRVMGRLAQLFILLGLWPFLKSLGLAERGALGYAVPGPMLRRSVVAGWALGVLILLALVVMLLVLDIRVPETHPLTWSRLTGKVAQALIGGLLIGVLEETFFRGALYSAIRGREGLASALIWSSLLYAVLHFMKPGSLPADVAFDWSGSLSMLAHAFSDAFQWRHLDSMVALFLAGLFLAMVRERTGHIGWCIGLHAGWVLVIQVTRRLTDGHDAAGLSWLVGDYDGTIGWLAAAWIGALALLYWRVSGRRRD